MFKDKLKSLMNIDEKKEEGNEKKKIENLVFLVILLIITTIIINTIWKDKKITKNIQNSVTTKQLATSIVNNTENDTTIMETGNLEQNLEQKLETILNKITGVGEVTVCINYSESSEIIAMYNENSKVSNTEETDTSGGVRKIEQTDIQKDIIYKEENGQKEPITQKIKQPKIEGAIVVAKGANDINVKTNIIQAVEAVTGISTHKIQVFEMK